MIHIEIKLTMTRDGSGKTGGGTMFFDMDDDAAGAAAVKELELALVRFAQDWEPTGSKK